ncbi:MAG: SDR family NAD(P)-dependent oxidoreductase [Solirubrobacteraceae bacterium]|jgi:dTDP-glucose 4,6-dehydratase
MHSWDGRKTLITGGAGFIGGHLAVALNRAGAQVRAFCRYNSRGDRGTLDWFPTPDTDGIEVVHGDLRDIESVTRAMAGIEVAFHLGAQIAVPYSFVSPRDFFATNVGGALNVAQAALGAGVGRLLHVSSSEVYGETREFPITSRHPLAPRSPYAASKAGADMLMESFHRAYALPVVIARPFNAYGPHQSARAIVPTIATQALQGGRVRLGSLAPRRDLTFVSDTVAGMIAVADADDAVGCTLQLGTGTDVSIGELVALIGELLGRSLDVEVDPRRVRPGSSELSRLVCDARHTTDITGWRPEIDVRTGITQTLAWLGQNAHRYRAREYAL